MPASRNPAAWLLLLSVAAPAAMQDENTLKLRADARVVEIDVAVHDSQGKPVPDLKKSDFTVMDNGKPRSFTIFSVNDFDDAGHAVGTSAENRPIPPQPLLPPNTFTNTHVTARPPEGHSTIILLDGMNGWFESFVWASQGVQGLMRKVPPDEKIALYVLQNGDGLGLLQDYTTDRTQLKEAMARYIPRGMHPSPPGMGKGPDGHGMIEEPVCVAAPKRVGPSGPPPPDASHRTPRECAGSLQLASEAVRLSLQALAEKLRTLPGRKSVFWITEGFPPVQLRGMNQIAWDKTVSALNDANVEVNTVDSDGLGGPDRFWGGGDILTMQQIANATGGQAYFHRNDLDAAMAADIADSRRSYTLGFYLTEMDGRYHELKVHVDRPGLELNYRQGYYAQSEAIRERSARKSDLQAALLSPLDLTGVGITASVEIVPGKPLGTLTAHLKLDPESLSLKEVAGGWNGKIEEMFLEQNALGREVGRISVTKVFEVDAAHKPKYDSGGAMFSQAIQLAPGTVKLSIVVRDTASGRTGSLTIPLNKVTP